MVFINIELSAFEIAAFDGFSELFVPFPDAVGDPSAGLRVSHEGVGREIRPFVFFFDLVFLLGVLGQVCEFHEFRIRINSQCAIVVFGLLLSIWPFVL